MREAAQGVSAASTALHDLCLGGIEIEAADLSGREITGCDFTGARFTGVSFTGCRILLSFFENACFVGCDFSRAAMQSSLFAGSYLEDCVLEDCELVQVSFLGVRARRVRFDHSNLYDSRFTGADLAGVTMRDCNLTRGALRPRPQAGGGLPFVQYDAGRLRQHGDGPGQGRGFPCGKSPGWPRVRFFVLFSHVGFSNAYLLGPRGGGDALLIDPGTFDTALLQAVESHGLYVRSIFVTHAHNAHINGIRSLLKVYKATIYSNQPSVLDFPARHIGDGHTIAPAASRWACVRPRALH